MGSCIWTPGPPDYEGHNPVALGGGGQASVRDSVGGSPVGSCCASGITMLRWSFSRDCFICGGERKHEAHWPDWGAAGRGGGHTHLVEQRDGRLQDLLPLAELRLVELPLQVQHLSPLTRRLRQGAGGGIQRL